MDKLPAEMLCGVFDETRSRQAIAQQLANQLSLPVVNSTELSGGYAIVVTEQRIEIRSCNHPPLHGAVYVDFVGGKAAHRRNFGGGRGQPLARAIGIKTGVAPTVIDATAGLGRDAFVLASLGCTVTMIEQSPAIAALLEDGLSRARINATTTDIANRMTLNVGDASDLLQSLSTPDQPDVVYLDPMYPPRDKSAAVKKEMQVLQALVEHSNNEAELLECARRFARKRVVVKRPSSAEPIAQLSPHSSIKSPNTRYDIYLPQQR